MAKKEKVQLTAPWTTYYRKVKALFGKDPEITIVYDEDNTTLKLFIDNADKAVAIEELLPAEVSWGQTTMEIAVIPANRKMSKFARENLFAAAFKGSPVFSRATTLDYDEMSNPMTFVEFTAEVVQYYDDNIGSLTGLTSTLYEDIARELFDLEGVYFSTAKNEVYKWATVASCE